MNSTVDRQKLNENQLSLKVAKLFGWKFNQHDLDSAWHDRLGDGPPPNYAGDLNAMHLAEKWLLLDEHKGYAYDMALCRIVNAYEAEGLCNHMRLFHATALQRAEAFVKTMEAK